MKRIPVPLRYAYGLILFIVCCMNCAYAQPAAGTTPSQPGERRRPKGLVEKYDRNAAELAIEQPFNSVLVRIRFKKEYGYKVKSSQAGTPAVSSCDAFSVAFAKPARPSVANVLIPIRRPDKITEVDGYYHCEFLVTGLALDQEVAIAASVDDQGPWVGGTQSQPSANYQRVLTDRQRTVNLTQSDPRATMNFEMYLEPKAEFVQPKRSGPYIRKP